MQETRENFDKTKKVKAPKTKQINITFNLNDKEDLILYNYLKELSNTTATLKEMVLDYKQKNEDKENYTKDMIKNYMSTKNFRNELKISMKSDEMETFFTKLIEEAVVREVKNYFKYK